MAATLDWSQCPAVESIPGKVSGAWVFKDNRLPVATVFENLEDMSIEEVMEECDITREQIEAVLEFVAQGQSPDCPATHCPLAMRILLITERPRGFARALPGHTVTKPTLWGGSCQL
jgi:uncharacterized protein (DUF433 family)